MRREHLIQPTKLYKFNTLQKSNKPNKHNTSNNITFIINPPLF